MSEQTLHPSGGNYAVLAREMLKAFTKQGMAWFDNTACVVQANEAFTEVSGLSSGESTQDKFPQLLLQISSKQDGQVLIETESGSTLAWQIRFIESLNMWLVSVEDKTEEAIHESTQAFLSQSQKIYSWTYNLFDGSFKFTQSLPVEMGFKEPELHVEKFLQVLTNASRSALIAAIENSLLQKSKFELEIALDSQKGFYKIGGIVHHNNQLPNRIAGYLMPLSERESEVAKLHTVLAYKNKPIESLTLLGVDGYVNWKYSPKAGFESRGTMPSDHHELNGDLPQIVSILQQNKVHSRPAGQGKSSELEQAFYPVFNYKGNLVQIVAIEQKATKIELPFQVQHATLQEQIKLEQLKNKLLGLLVKKDFEGLYQQLPTVLLELPSINGASIIMADGVHGMVHILSKDGENARTVWNKEQKDWLVASLPALQEKPMLTSEANASANWTKHFADAGKSGMLLSLATLGKAQYVLEISFSRLSGAEYDMLLALPNALSTASDFDTFSALKEDIRKKEMLLKELNHRAKNNLAVVAGLLKLQSSFTNNVEAREALSESQSRIQSMSKLHEQLYKPAESELEVDMQAYFNELVSGFKDGMADSKVSIELDCEPIKLHHKKAVTCGLLVNEMVTNSLKHAFHEINQGKIEISLVVKNDLWYLAVADNGTGMTETTTQKLKDSLGMILIQEFVEQLNGQLAINSHQGTTFTITFTND